MKSYSVTNVDEYIAIAPKDAQPKLKELRAVIKSAVPKAQETISWGVPFYKYQGLLAGFAAFKNHVSFGLAFVFEDTDRKTLESQGYIMGKKTIQIGFDQKVPTKIITSILKTKAKLNELKTSVK